jgi:hypothetical protein
MPEREPAPIRPHQWVLLAVGRICRACLLVQPRGEFDDSVPCSGTQGRPPAVSPTGT